MKIVPGHPPNISQIDQVLGVRSSKSIIYTYGDTIYAPGGIGGVTEDLKVHESVHMEQQSAFDSPDDWWDRYLEDPEFRLEQEIEAYRKQYEYINLHGNRKQRREAKREIAKTLASQMYGNIITRLDAERLLES